MQEEIVGSAKRRLSQTYFSELGTCNYQANNYSHTDCKENTFRQQFIAGGNDTQPPEYMISIQLPKKVQGNWGPCFKHICGGSLIAPNLVLTAAHCLDDFKWQIDEKHGKINPKVQIYVTQAPQCRHETGRKRLGVLRTFTHPDYDNKVYSDVAILEVMGSFAGPYIDYQSSLNLELEEDTDLQLMGYGQQSVIDTGYNRVPFQSLIVPYTADEICKVLVQHTLRANFHSNNMLCTYQRSGGSCEGDSGGPLVLKQVNNQNDVQVGIVSWGNFSLCGDNAPTVFVRVGQADILFWIDQKVQQFGTAHGSVQWEKPAPLQGFDVYLSQDEMQLPPVLLDECNNYEALQCDVDALLNFKNSVTRGSLLLSTWKGTNPCTWDYIVCARVHKANKRVVQVDMNYCIQPDAYTLSATLVPEFSKMRYISEFYLHCQNITGQLLEEFSVLDKLTMFWVAKTELTGTLPSTYSSWTNIQEFVSSYNNIVGKIPVEWSQWTKLEYLGIAVNKLSGTLAEEFSTWVQLNDISVSLNRLSGTLSPTFSTWDKMIELNMCNNDFFGTLPLEYSTMISMQIFATGHNMFTGVLPATFSTWNNVMELHAFNNDFSGTLPLEYSTMISMDYFAVNHNMFTSVLPLSYSTWYSATKFYVYNNEFNGTFPREYSTITAMNDFAASENMFTNGFPPQWSTWRDCAYFWSQNCLLTGTLPKEYSTMIALDTLSVSSNYLNGKIPPEYSTWRQCTEFYVWGNRITGTLPPEYSTMLRMTKFSASSNYNLSGPLVPEYSNWRLCTEFHIWDNKITGTLPPEYSARLRMEQFFVSDNDKLFGTLPPEYSTLLFLEEFYAKRTSVDSSIPNEWSVFDSSVIISV